MIRLPKTSPPSRRLRALSAVACVGTLSALALVTASPAASATSYVVDQASPACTDATAPRPATPFCTIRAGASAARAGGDVVTVMPGTYREGVSPFNQNAATPGTVTFTATPGTVTVNGTRDLSDTAGWTAPTPPSTVWSRPFLPSSALNGTVANTTVNQVFLSGVRMPRAASLAALTAGSYFYDNTVNAQTLYVDLGAGAPGVGNTIEASDWNHGFNFSSRSNFVVDGFTFYGQNAEAVQVSSSSSVVVRNVSVSYTGVYGIELVNATNTTVENSEIHHATSAGIRMDTTSGSTVQGNSSHDNGFHGIGTSMSTGNTIAGNTLYANFHPGVPTANGIDLNGDSTDNTVRANIMHGNEDSGIQVYVRSHRTLVVRNVSYRNGDHGFDSLGSTNGRYVSNTSYGNTTDGFSFEGNSFGATGANNVAADNGNNELYVAGPGGTNDTTANGFQFDYGIYFKSGPGNVVGFNGTSYPTLAAFRTANPTQELNGISKDPRFINAATNDFRIRASSPAIDAANAQFAGFVAADQRGQVPVDNTAVVDTGVGTPTFADRGAYEWRTGDVVGEPVAALTVTPASGSVPLLVTANSSGSTDAGGSIGNRLYEWGDGTAATSTSATTATHTYNLVGTFTASVTVTDNAGNTARATRLVTVTGNTAPIVSFTLPTSARFLSSVTANASASTDPGGAITSYTFNWGDGSSTTQATPVASHRYLLIGKYTVTVTARDAGNLTGSASKVIYIRLL